MRTLGSSSTINTVSPGFARRALETRQPESDCRAASELALDLDAAGGLAREAVHHRKAETGAFAGRLRREERIEGAERDVGRHPATGVGDGEGEIFARRDV